MNTFHRFIVMLIGISLVVGPVVSWAAKGPCALKYPSSGEKEGKFRCVNGHYMGTVKYHCLIGICEDADENDCNPNENPCTVTRIYVYSTKQSDNQKAAQKAEHDVIGNNAIKCGAVSGAAAGVAAWCFVWAGPAGSIAAGAVAGIVGTVSCGVIQKRQLDAHEAKIASCLFVSPDSGEPIEIKGFSCR